jgi:MFS family permease
MLGLLLPVYGREIGADVVEIGLFYSAFSIMTVVLRPLVGRALDRFGRRPFFIIGLAAYGVAMASFATGDSVGQVLLARIMQGVASSFVWLAAYAITADVAGSLQRGRAFGSVIQASTRGSIVGVFAGYLLLELRVSADGVNFTGGWSAMFVAFGLLSLYAMIVAWRRLPETRPAVVNEAPQRIVWSRAWLILLLVVLVTGASWAMISPLMIIFLQDKLAVSVETLAWAYLPSGLVWALLPARLGTLADRFGRKALMVVGLLAAAVGSLLLPSLTAVAAFAALWAILAVGFAAGDPAEQALVADLAGHDQRGRAYGYYALAADLGAAVGPFAGTWLYQHAGRAIPFYANSAVLFLAAVVLLLFLRVPRLSQADAPGDLPVNA